MGDESGDEREDESEDEEEGEDEDAFSDDSGTYTRDILMLQADDKERPGGGEGEVLANAGSSSDGGQRAGLSRAKAGAGRGEGVDTDGGGSIGAAAMEVEEQEEEEEEFSEPGEDSLADDETTLAEVRGYQSSPWGVVYIRGSWINVSTQDKNTTVSCFAVLPYHRVGERGGEPGNPLPDCLGWLKAWLFKLCIKRTNTHAEREIDRKSCRRFLLV